LDRVISGEGVDACRGDRELATGLALSGHRAASWLTARASCVAWRFSASVRHDGAQIPNPAGRFVVLAGSTRTDPAQAPRWRSRYRAGVRA
jgi:hypothetical protein